MDKIQDKLMSCFQEMDSAYDDYAESKGLSYLSLMVLEEIYELGDGVTQKQISEDTRYPKQAVNLAVRSFLDEGYIELKEMQENRRNKQISLTDKGRCFCEETVVPLIKNEDKALADMGEAECAELIRLLELYSRLYCRGLDELK